MQYIILIIYIFLTANVFSQDSTEVEFNKWAKCKLDNVTGKTSCTIKNAIIAKSKSGSVLIIDIIESSTGDAILFDASSSSLACIDETSKIYILYKDGSRETLFNGLGFNCDGGNTAILYKQLSDEWGDLMEKKIDIIRVMGRTKSIEATLTDAMATQIKNAIIQLYKHKR